MKKNSIQRLVFAGALSLLAFGCSTKESRIKENAAAFAALPADQQQIIRGGFIAMGFTPEMVYMSLDKPERVIPGNGPGNETWIYHNFYASDGSSNNMAMKITNSGASNAKTSGGGAGSAGGKNNFQVGYDAEADTYKTQSAIKVHVKFVDGKVSDIQIVNNGKV